MAVVQQCHHIARKCEYLIKSSLQELSDFLRLLEALLKKLSDSATSHCYKTMKAIKENSNLDLGL